MAKQKAKSPADNQEGGVPRGLKATLMRELIAKNPGMGNLDLADQFLARMKGQGYEETRDRQKVAQSFAIEKSNAKRKAAEAGAGQSGGGQAGAGNNGGEVQGERKKPGRKPGSGRKGGAGLVAAGTRGRGNAAAGEPTVSDLLKVRDFAVSLGSLERLKAAVDALDKLTGSGNHG